MTASPDGQVSVERRTLWIVLLLNVVIAAGFF
ncbi:MAG: cation transporter, partial [Sphingomonas sp.]|nr:cation transporter [Sphingomonas sp.]